MEVRIKSKCYQAWNVGSGMLNRTGKSICTSYSIAAVTMLS